MFDTNTLNRLACPACLGNLSAQPSGKPDVLVCAQCCRKYPVIDGIPMLVAERAEKQA